MRGRKSRPTFFLGQLKPTFFEIRLYLGTVGLCVFLVGNTQYLSEESTFGSQDVQLWILWILKLMGTTWDARKKTSKQPTLQSTNMAVENHHVFIDDASSNGCFSIVILVFGGVNILASGKRTENLAAGCQKVMFF